MPARRAADTAGRQQVTADAAATRGIIRPLHSRSDPGTQHHGRVDSPTNGPLVYVWPENEVLTDALRQWQLEGFHLIARGRGLSVTNSSVSNVYFASVRLF